MVSPITTSDPISPLENLLNPIIAAITDVEGGSARSDRTIYYADDLAALPSSSLKEGDLCHVDEGDYWMGRIDSSWIVVTTPRFASTSALGTAFAKASGAYRSTGLKAFVTADNTSYRWNGAAWKAWESDWITYTSTPTNLTVGSGGSITARYRWVQGEVEHDIIVLLGSSPTVGAGPTLTTAVTLYNPSSGTARGFTGDVFYMDEGTGVVPGTVIVPSAGTTMLPRYQSSSSGVTAALTGSAPFNWVAGDRMFIRFTAPAA